MRVTVYAGSATGRDPLLAEQVEIFVRDLVKAGAEIVYGGGSVGLMGVVADTALAFGGRVTGVIPESLVHAEVGHTSLTTLDVVGSMHTRKERMAELADCFVALPGGIGTLEELFEVWAALILGHHGKPIALFNPGGYWDPLMRALRGMADAGFMAAAECACLIPVTDAEEFLETVAAWRPPAPRWGGPRAEGETQP